MYLLPGSCKRLCLVQPSITWIQRSYVYPITNNNKQRNSSFIQKMQFQIQQNTQLHEKIMAIKNNSLGSDSGWSQYNNSYKTYTCEAKMDSASSFSFSFSKTFTLTSILFHSHILLGLGASQKKSPRTVQCVRIGWVFHIFWAVSLPSTNPNFIHKQIFICLLFLNLDFSESN